MVRYGAMCGVMCGMMCGMMCGVMCDVMWCGVMCGVMWCGVMCDVMCDVCEVGYAPLCVQCAALKWCTRDTLQQCLPSSTSRDSQCISPTCCSLSSCAMLRYRCLSFQCVVCLCCSSGSQWVGCAQPRCTEQVL